MIDFNKYIQELSEASGVDKQPVDNYQKELFEQYALRNGSHIAERQHLYKAYLSGQDLFGKDGLRRQLAAFDLEYFGRAYLPHYFTRKSPEFHRQLDDMWEKGVLKDKNPFKDPKEIDKLDGTRNGVAAPRGHAKSTNITFKDSLHAALYRYKHYIMILSDSSEQAEGFLSDMKTELEENQDIIGDFGKQEGRKWKTSEIITKGNIKISAIGSGKKVRCRKHKNWRPDLIILDDIENDENVNTPEQRKKLYSWFTKAVSKAGDTYTDIVVVGTILHYDALLSKVLVNPRYKVKKYKAVIQDATNTNLWDDWERIYTDLNNPEHEQDAAAFFESHKEDMLEGVKVLWQEKLDYYDLMVIKVTEGEAAFNSEMQNEPFDPENTAFREEWLKYYEESQLDFKDPEFVFIGADDPSLAKNKKSDTSGIIGIALSLKTGIMYILDASIERRKPNVIIDDVIAMSKMYKVEYGKGFYIFGVEDVQFQAFFAEVLAERSREAEEYIPVEPVKNTQNKHVRIMSLQPFIKNGYLRFNAKHKTLIKQLLEYPHAKNDDAPDTLEMCVRLAREVKKTATKVEYKSVVKRVLNFRKGAY